MGREIVKNMKLSRYNNYVAYEDKIHLIYNALSGALLKTNKKLFHQIKDIEEGKSTESLASLPPAVLENCKAEQVIVPGDLDEVKQIAVASLKDRFSDSTLSITIAPTMDCLFSCEYCYEKHEKKYMTRETQEALLSFVAQKLEGSETLDVVWYGGEPLMAADTVFSMTESLAHLCETHNVALSLSMITNGFLLTRDVAERMYELGIHNIQVTLDGPREVHDARRHLTHGGNTFDTIISNLLACEGVIPNIVIRVNVDRANFDCVKELEGYLESKGILRFADIDLSLVDAIAEINVPYASKCLSGAEFSDINLDFLARNLEKGIAFPEPPRGSSCGAITENGYVIGPDGSLYKCWSEVGYPLKRVGHIQDMDSVTPAYYDWLSFDILAFAECRECRLLPMCMGACPDKLKKMEKGNCCTRWKHNFEEMVLMYYISTVKKITGGKENGKET